jgi:hypothetical protein
MSNNFKSMINSYVELIKNKMETEHCKFLKKHHYDEYLEEMNNFVPKFKEEYPILFKIILENQDLSILNIFLDNIEDIDSGKKEINEVRNNLGQLLHNKYINNK